MWKCIVELLCVYSIFSLNVCHRVLTFLLANDNVNINFKMNDNIQIAFPYKDNTPNFFFNNKERQRRKQEEGLLLFNS